MTCNDCIHYDVCKDDYELGYLFKDENGNYFTDDCQYFKNKADFVEVVRCKDCLHKINYKGRAMCTLAVTEKGKQTMPCKDCELRKYYKSDVEKAIEYFNRRLFDAHGYPIDKNHTETAVKALYKANKLSPISYDKHYYKCPCCKEDLGIDDDGIFVYEETPPNFCKECGQALDWSDIK